MQKSRGKEELQPYHRLRRFRDMAGALRHGAEPVAGGNEGVESEPWRFRRAHNPHELRLLDAAPAM